MIFHRNDEELAKKYADYLDYLIDPETGIFPTNQVEDAFVDFANELRENIANEVRS